MYDFYIKMELWENCKYKFMFNLSRACAHPTSTLSYVRPTTPLQEMTYKAHGWSACWQGTSPEDNLLVAWLLWARAWVCDALEKHVNDTNQKRDEVNNPYAKIILVSFAKISMTSIMYLNCSQKISFWMFALGWRIRHIMLAIVVNFVFLVLFC